MTGRLSKAAAASATAVFRATPAAALTALAVACSVAPPPGMHSDQPAAQSVTPMSGMGEPTGSQPPTTANTPIRIIIGDAVVTGELDWPG